MKNPEVIIPISKNKSLLAFLGCIVFVLLGGWIIKSEAVFFPLNWIIGGASVGFFGLGSIFILKNFFQQEPGLVINNEGITDNSSAVSVGFIPWEEITRIGSTEVFSQKFVLIFVDDPEKYLNRPSSEISRKAAKSNYNNYGTPITISANSLKINFKKLVGTLNTWFPQ